MKNKIAVIGAPNVGKSSIVNAIVGENVGIVTDLAGTTRDLIRGFAKNFEIIDTPGMLKSDDLLSRHMRKSISAGVRDADLILYVMDATRIDDRDIEKIGNYRDKIPVVVAVNKSDKTTHAKFFPGLERLKPLDFVHAIVPCSAKTGFNIDVLESELGRALKNKGEAIDQADPDDFTDQSVKKMAGEIIRASIIQNMYDEIPHGVAVLITKFIESAKVIEIHADIICEKQSHKPMIIGKRGENIKKIGIQSRVEIAKLVDCDVRLFTHVIVRPGWKNDKELLNRIHQLHV